MRGGDVTALLRILIEIEQRHRIKTFGIEFGELHLARLGEAVMEPGNSPDYRRG